jgi:hypothetical protein
LLIVKNEFADSGREAPPLPLAFLGPSLRSVVGWDAGSSSPDGVRRSAQLMGGDMRHRGRLARRQCSELRWVGHPARRGIGLESRLACITPTHLTADPGPTEIDSVAGPAVTWLLIFEQMQHVLGTQECPISQQSVVFVRQGATTTDGDEPRIALFREDRHAPIPTIHEAASSGSPYRLRLAPGMRLPTLTVILRLAPSPLPACALSLSKRASHAACDMPVSLDMWFGVGNQRAAKQTRIAHKVACRPTASADLDRVGFYPRTINE